MRGIVVALALVGQRGAHADDYCDGPARPAVLEWTYWLGLGGGTGGFGLRAGAGADLEVLQLPNPWHYGGKFEVRLGPWISADTTFDRHFFEGGVALDIGQTKHAQFGTYTVRLGGGTDADGRPIGSLTVLGGVRYVPKRYCTDANNDHRPSIAFASGARVFATMRTDFEQESLWLIGIEFEPTWLLPPYSLGKLAGSHHNF